MNLYDFKVRNIDQEQVKMADYKGKVLLIVNTATGCGFTPQYEGLEAMYEKYKDKGFEILDFPCNQFLGQAPGTDAEIVSFCQLRYGTTFQTFSKIDVNGKNADPLFEFLKENGPDEYEEEEAGVFKKAIKNITETFTGKDIKWNFTKFLVNREGEIVARFAPSTKPEDIDPFVEKLL